MGPIIVHSPQGQCGFMDAVQKGLTMGSMLCSNCLEVGTRGSTFSFVPSPANYAMGPAMGFLFFIVGPWGNDSRSPQGSGGHRQNQ